MEGVADFNQSRKKNNRMIIKKWGMFFLTALGYKVEKRCGARGGRPRTSEEVSRRRGVTTAFILYILFLLFGGGKDRGPTPNGFNLGILFRHRAWVLGYEKRFHLKIAEF